MRIHNYLWSFNSFDLTNYSEASQLIVLSKGNKFHNFTCLDLLNIVYLVDVQSVPVCYIHADVICCEMNDNTMLSQSFTCSWWQCFKHGLTLMAIEVLRRRMCQTVSHTAKAHQVYCGQEGRRRLPSSISHSYMPWNWKNSVRLHQINLGLR